MEWFQFLSNPDFWLIFCSVSFVLGWVDIFITSYRIQRSNFQSSPRTLIQQPKSRKHKHIVVQQEKNPPNIREILVSIYEVVKEDWKDGKVFFILGLILLCFLGIPFFVFRLFQKN